MIDRMSRDAPTVQRLLQFVLIIISGKNTIGNKIMATFGHVDWITGRWTCRCPNMLPVVLWKLGYRYQVPGTGSWQSYRHIGTYDNFRMHFGNGSQILLSQAGSNHPYTSWQRSTDTMIPVAVAWAKWTHVSWYGNQMLIVHRYTGMHSSYICTVQYLLHSMYRESLLSHPRQGAQK